MPPTGVLMSTCLSWPFFSLLTLMLHAGSSNINPSSVTNMARMDGTLILPTGTSARDLRRAFQSGASLGDIRNRDRQAPANGNFAEQRLDRSHFRHGRIRESTEVGLDLGEVARQVGIPHGDHRGLSGGVIEKVFKKRSGRIRHRHGIADLARHRTHING